MVGPIGGTAPLSGDEVREALRELPYWAGDRNGLTRTISLPPGNLELVLRRLADIKRQLGRGPQITRDGDGSATITVRSAGVGASIAPDVDLAHRVDAVLDEAGAGMNYGLTVGRLLLERVRDERAAVLVQVEVAADRRRRPAAGRSAARTSCSPGRSAWRRRPRRRSMPAE